LNVLRRYWRFLREVRAELKKVVWPDADKTTTYTGVVLFSVALVAAIIWVADTLSTAGIRLIIT